MKTFSRLMILAALAAAPLPLMAQQQPQGGEAPPPTAVTVVTLKSQDVTLTSSLPGRVLASAEAEVRPQVDGIIIERLFEEGSAVQAGDPLYRIDSRTYDAALAQAEASLAQAEAQSAAASREAERVATLRERRVVSEQDQDSAIAARDAAAAAVQAAEAQLQAARINLDRTTIRAQLSGVIGLAQASQGSLVTAGQATPLAVIRAIDPVRVDVTQSAAEIIRWRSGGGAASLPEGTDRTVKLLLADGTQFEQTGSLTAAEPNVEETTGLVTLRMQVENPDDVLLPGMYVKAEIPQALIKDAVLVPMEGVTRDRRGRPMAMVVTPENVVEQRELTIAQDRGNTWVVTEGLEAGDRVIVEGLQKIQPGAKVAPEEQQPQPAAGDAAAEPAAAPADGDGVAPGAEAAGPDATDAHATAAGADAGSGGAVGAPDQAAPAAGAEQVAAEPASPEADAGGAPDAGGAAANAATTTETPAPETSPEGESAAQN